MKPLVQLSLALGLVTQIGFVWPCFAAKSIGPNDGTGGDVKTSVRPDIEAITKNMNRYAWEMADSYLLGKPLVIADAPLHSDLAAITQKVMGAPYFTISESLEKYLNRLKFNIVDEPCYEEGIEKDASTEPVQEAPICLSATRLSRFPRSALRIVLMPLILHEVAHQFGFKESEAKALQDLADLHIKYRTTYLAALRATNMCGMASHTLKNIEDQALFMSDVRRIADQNMPVKYSQWAKVITQANRKEALPSCASFAMETAVDLRQNFDGDGWNAIPSNLTVRQQKLLELYVLAPETFGYFVINHALTEPALAEECLVCNSKVDKPLLMMLGAAAAADYVRYLIEQGQNAIVIGK